MVLVTAHRACLEADWAGLHQRMRTPMVYDGRRVLDLDALASDFHTGKISGDDTVTVLKETHTEDELKKLYWTICEKAGLFPGDCTMTDEENSLWELLDSTETEDYWDTEWK